MLPLPAPKAALEYANESISFQIANSLKPYRFINKPVVRYPKCLHTTCESVPLPKLLSHTVPHTLPLQISTLPSLLILPSAKRRSPSSQGAISINKQQFSTTVFTQSN